MGVLTHSVCAQLPTAFGMFTVHLYEEEPGRQYFAFVKGACGEGPEPVLVRIQSGCFTSSATGSLRRDCIHHLSLSMGMIGKESRGIVLYLPPGHLAGEREYCTAGYILQGLGVHSVKLLTNNPEKLEALGRTGVQVAERIPLEGAGDLPVRVKMLQRIFSVPLPGTPGERNEQSERCVHNNMPYVTLCYAQSIDGSIAAGPGQRLQLSCRESLTYVHELRSRHDAILVGIGTVLSDDPRLTVRYAAGSHPQPIVVDSRLRIPLNSYLVQEHPLPPWIAAAAQASPEKRSALERRNATIIEIPVAENGFLELAELLRHLYKRGVRTLMVEGGARIINSFISRKLACRLVVTIAPVLVGGIPAIKRGEAFSFPCALRTFRYERWGKDIVIEGELS